MKYYLVCGLKLRYWPFAGSCEGEVITTKHRHTDNATQPANRVYQMIFLGWTNTKTNIICKAHIL